MPAVECEYEVLPDQIHVLTFHQLNEAALNQCFAYLHTIFQEAPRDQPLRLLSDITIREMPPIKELWQLTRALLADFPQRPPIHNAVLYVDDSSRAPFISLMNMLAEFFGAQARIFWREDRQQAIRWLLES